MLSLQSKEIVSFEKSIQLIKEMLNILKRETLFGKSHKNILEQYLYLSGLLGYYNSINDDFDGVLKVSKKIDKYLNNVQDIMKNNEMKNDNNENSQDNSVQYNNLYQQYNYFNTMLKSSVNLNNNNNASALKESQANIKKMQNKIKQSEIDLLNINILEGNDLKMSTQFKNMIELFKKWIGQKVELKSDKIILMYFCLYNQISVLTKKILDEMNSQNVSQNIKKVRQFATEIIEMTGKQVVDQKNEDMKKIFQLPFFKNLFNRLYYVRIYSYFLEGNYKDCLKDFGNYKLAKIQYELETPKSNEYMKKIEADCLFKLQNYKEAEEIYDRIIGMGSDDSFVHFNLGLCAYFNDKKSKALAELESAISIFRKENNVKNAKIAEEILSKIKK
jgi:tetratricopeptide (TPR) repeat protein